MELKQDSSGTKAPTTVATVFYRYRPSPDFQTFRFVVQELLAEGVRVHCVCSTDLRLPEHPLLTLHVLKFPHWIRHAWYTRSLFEIAVPIVLAKLILREKLSAIMSTKGEWSFAAVPARIFTRRPLITFVDATPWTIRRFSRKSRLRRFIGLMVDYLGLLASSKIVAATASIEAELKERLPFAAARVCSVPPAIAPLVELPRDTEGKLAPEPWKNWINGQPKRRRELAKKYQLSERWRILVAPLDLVDRAQLETLLRAVSVIDEDRFALFLCGVNTESETIRSLTSGLGMQDQIIYVENRDELPEILAGSDLYIYPLRYSGGSRLLAEALGSGATVLAVDGEESLEILHEKQLLFPPSDVEKLLERLKQAMEDKAQTERLRQITRSRAMEISGSWGRAFVQAMNVGEG